MSKLRSQLEDTLGMGSAVLILGWPPFAVGWGLYSGDTDILAVGLFVLMLYFGIAVAFLASAWGPLEPYEETLKWVGGVIVASATGVGMWGTFAWLHAFKRLRIRYERRADTHQAFISLACSIICLRKLIPN